MQNLQTIIETAYTKISEITPQNVEKQIRDAVQETIKLLDNGTIRVASKENGNWQIHEWVKKAVLLSFRITANEVINAGFTNFFDKIPLKFANFSENQFQQQNARIVPSACVRQGAFIGANTIVMPSFVNIGAYIDTGVMIDTWATVGSCAQIGKSVHLSGGVGIGGVLEPLQAQPTIIEDNVFIGARSEVVEGVIIEEGSVLSMGVYIGQSTPIYDRATDKIHYGRVPQGSVVVPGTLPSKDGKYNLYAAVIVKKVDAKTRGKISINELLRESTMS